MIVEDDFDIREAVADTLADEGYEVVQAGDDAQALALLRAMPRPPQLILLDRG